jgi:hypothetical protein
MSKTGDIIFAVLNTILMGCAFLILSYGYAMSGAHGMSIPPLFILVVLVSAVAGWALLAYSKEYIWERRVALFFVLLPWIVVSGFLIVPHFF